MAAVVLAAELGAILAGVVLITQTLSAVALSISGTLVGAHLERAISSLPSTEASACTIIAVTVAKAVVQANTRVAIIIVPPMLTAANPG